MRLVGCQYCKKARAFWAYDSHGSPHGSYQNAHIEVGTNAKQNAERKKIADDLKRAEKRQKELDNLFAKLYEDRIAERITERNFIMLSAKYQEEQNALDGKIDLLNGQISENSERYSNIETWVKLIKQYASPTELDSILLNALVEKITVHEAIKHEDGSREQEVEIFYKFVGKID